MEKIDVHGAPCLNWGAADNQIKEIRRLTTLLARHPAFFDRTDLTLIQTGGGNQIVLLRHHNPTGKQLMVVANLDEAEQLENVVVFHAGTAIRDGRTVTNGGRVLGVTAIGEGISDAQARAYEAVNTITFEGAYWRRDIGDKAVNRQKVSSAD
jgi:hypothetical protein